MAEEHVGPRPVAWTKIFTGFKVALDLKKLLLAAAGVLSTALGWWLLSVVAYNLPIFSTKPEWKNYLQNATNEEQKKAAFTSFRASRASWNLLHELAGSGDVPIDAADVAQSYKELEALQEIELAYNRYHHETLEISGKEKDLTLRLVGGKSYFGSIADTKDPEREFKKKGRPGPRHPAGRR